MPLARRIRGLLGSTLTWGAVGALIGAIGCVVRYTPWPLNAVHWDRFLVLFGAFVGAGALWGSVAGLAFGLLLWRIGRRKSWQQLSTSRVAWWGAVAGAAFPVLLYTPLVVASGAVSALPFYALLTGLSAVAGAGCARAVVALAKQSALRETNAALLAAPGLGVAQDLLQEAPERVR